MQYTKYEFSIGGLPEGLEVETVTDVLSSLLGSVGFESFEVEDDALCAYIQTDAIDEELMGSIVGSFPLQEVSLSWTKHPIEEVNWNEEWEKNYFQPIILSDGMCVIRAPFHDTSALNARTEIVISPKMAFGTGNHETTALMISYLMEQDLQGCKVLDMGCGTGILGILALKQGAKSLTAIDIDEWAYLNVLENATLNDVEIDEAIQGDASVLRGRGGYDLILANITRNILYEDMPAYVSSLGERGKIVFSGFYEEDVEILRTRGEDLGLRYLSHRSDNRWALLEMLLM